MEIAARNPIDYSQATNLDLVSQDLVTLDSQLEWGSRSGSYGEVTDEKSNGSLKMRQIIISPAQVARFLSVQYVNPVVNNSDVQLLNTTWRGISEQCFDFLDDKLGTQLNVLGKDNTIAGDEQASVNVWFTGGYGNILNGQVYFSSVDDEMQYRLKVPLKSSMLSPIDSENCYFTLLKISLPEYGLQPFGWKSKNNKATVSVVDIYGNTGTFHLMWDEDRFYDEPFFMS